MFKENAEKRWLQCNKGWFGDIEVLVNNPTKGQFKAAGVPVKRYLREFKLEDISAYEVGQEIKVDIFEAGEK